jgi:hypothetical protein
MSTKRTAAAASSSRAWGVIWAGLAVVGIAAIVSILLSNDGGNATTEQTAPVSVAGDALPTWSDAVEDTAVRTTPPRVEGTTFEGVPVTIDPTDGPMAIMLVAHWCPHCQNEVAGLREWLTTNQLPTGFELVTVSTWVDPARPNYPPSTWLAAPDWPVSTLVDDVDSSVATAYGMSSTPFWVFVDGSGKVAARTAGAIGPERILEIAGRLLAG